ncbi:hypothetical protein Tco_0590215, partial [Tanacetum coccineum]
HITDNGWDPLYIVWDKHGEPTLPTPPPQATPTPPPLRSDMTALLDDLSYIPPNNEHNEPIQGDISETSNEPTQATRNEFEDLYSSANEALYPGCDHVTRLDFTAKFTYFKVKGKLTDSIFNEMLEWLQYALPESKGYKFPPSYYAIKKTFKMIGLGDPPKEYPRDVILAQHARLLTRVSGKHPKHGGVKIKRNVEVELNWTKRKICSQTLMEDDMLKAQSNVVDILCNLKLIYPPAFFDIMISLELSFNYRAIFGGPIRPREFLTKTMKSKNSPVVWEAADVARGYGGDGGGDDRPPPYQVRAPESPIWVQESGQAAYPPGDPEPRAHWANTSGPSLDLRPTWIRTLAYKSLRHPGALPKIYKWQEMVLSKKDIRFLKRTGLMTWSASDADVPHTFLSILLRRILDPRDKALYGLGSNTPTGVPYTEDEIMAIIRGGKQRGHIPGVGRFLPGQGTVIPPPSQSTHSADIARLKKRRMGGEECGEDGSRTSGHSGVVGAGMMSQAMMRTTGEDEDDSIEGFVCNVFGLDSILVLKVYDLKGGILKYLEEVPENESLWDDECFVFDKRVSVQHGLVPGNFKLCYGCKKPVCDADMESSEWEYGVTFPYCYASKSEEEKERPRA